MNKIGEAQYSPGFVPGDLAAAGTTGKWFSMKNFNHIEFIIVKSAGAAGEIPTFTFLQATSAAGAGSKALNFPQYAIKDNADLTTVITGPTKVAVTPPANTLAPAAGNTQSVIVVEFDAQNLDVTNGFEWCSVTVNDVGTTAQLAACIVRQSECRFDPMTANPYG